MKLLRYRILAALAALGLIIPAVAHSQQNIPLSTRATTKTAAVAETRLIMEGIAQSNYKGLERMLKTKPEDSDAWTFVRGQALLVAETGNLLLMRPPKNQGQESWNKTSIELREAATQLARAASARDLNESRASLIEVANSCNKCHQQFGVATRMKPFAEEKKPAPMPPQ